MMKYIRTENGIYEVSEKITYCGKNFYYTTAEVTLEDVYIVNQADTIEELCDLFVYEKLCYDKTVVRMMFKKISRKSLSKEDIAELKEPITDMVGLIGLGVGKYQIERGIYGAIWTDKGLIYVAKMDEKGDLVLI